MLEIIDSVDGLLDELIEESRKILIAELKRIECDKKSDEYELTIESVYSKLCSIKLELKIGTTKMKSLDRNEIYRLTDKLFNGGNVIGKTNLLCD